MNRNEFQKKAKQQIDELFVKIDELEAKSDKLSDKAKAEVDEKISAPKTFDPSEPTYQLGDSPSDPTAYDPSKPMYPQHKQSFWARYFS